MAYQTHDDLLSGSQWKASDFIARNYFGHVSPPPDQEDCYERSLRLGTAPCLAENIGYCQPGCTRDASAPADALVQMWLRSDAHASNLLSSSYRLIGAGVAYDPASQKLYGVAQFSR